MGFGTDFQGKSSHESLVHIQEQEIKLLENMKRCLNVRIKSDKSYADSLASLVKEAQKFSCPDYQPFCVVFQAWETIVQQTDQFVQYLNRNVSELTSETLIRLNDLINEKKAAKKFYLEERTRLEQEFTKVQDDVQKNKQEYSKSVNRLSQDEAKYNDSKTKGKQAKVEEAKAKYQRSASKLHKVHNDYVISLKAVVSHQKCYLQDTLPSFLDYHQTVQEILVQQCKEVLKQFHKLTDFSNTECCDIYQAMEESIGLINPEKEYGSEQFIEQFRSPPIDPISFDFGNSLLADYQGKNLVENELTVDDLTHSDLSSKKSEVEQEISRLQLLLKNKEDALKALKDQIEKIDSTEWQQKEHQEKRKNSDKLGCEVLEVKGKLTIQNDILSYIKSALDGVGNSVPLALDFSALDSADKSEDSNSAGVLSPSPSGARSRFKLSIPHFKSKEKLVPEKESRQSYDETTVSGANGPKIQSVPKNDSQSSINNSHNVPIEEEEWFHGVLPREEVQRLLCNNGDYLVRESKNRKTNEPQYVLSAFFDGHKHFIIQYSESGWRFEGETFPTISALVHYQHNSGLPVTSRSQAILKNPIIREQWQLRNDDIALEVKIGNGNFGEVYKGSYKPKSTIVAVKTCKDTLSEDQRRKFLQEGRILKQYDHPNIVRFIGIAAQRQPVMIVMEYVAGGALLSYLRKHGKTQSKKQLAKMCEDASRGMAYLESKNCIHRDLAARNCLVGDKQVVKISDFGMSREEEEYTVSDGLKQIPIKWTAPEALMYGKYTSLCDVWSFGILMWEIFSSGVTPYQGMTNNQAREKIDAGYRMPSPEGTPQDCYDLMMKCWEYNPNKRIHFDAIQKELQSIGKKL